MEVTSRFICRILNSNYISIPRVTDYDVKTELDQGSKEGVPKEEIPFDFLVLCRGLLGPEGERPKGHSRRSLNVVNIKHHDGSLVTWSIPNTSSSPACL